MAKEARNGLRLIDRLVLFLAWAATCGLVYVLGFYVGKGTHEQQLGKHQRVVRLPINAAPPPPDARTGRSSEFTFYETLTAGRRDGAQPGEPGAETPGAAPGEPVASATPPAAATPPTPPAGTAAVPSKAPGAPAAPTAASPAQMARVPPPPPARPTTPPAVAPATPPAVATTPTTLPVRPAVPATTTGKWTVEVSPTPNRLELEALRARLSDKGYDARVVTVRRDGNTWYRLRVGRYSSSAQATQVMRTLREQEGVPRAFVASQ